MIKVMKLMAQGSENFQFSSESPSMTTGGGIVEDNNTVIFASVWGFTKLLMADEKHRDC